MHIHDFTASRAISGKRGHTVYSGCSIPMDSHAPTWNCRLLSLPPSLRIFYEKENRRNNPLPPPQTDALQPGWTIVLITIRHDHRTRLQSSPPENCHGNRQGHRPVAAFTHTDRMEGDNFSASADKAQYLPMGIPLKKKPSMACCMKSRMYGGFYLIFENGTVFPGNDCTGKPGKRSVYSI